MIAADNRKIYCFTPCSKGRVAEGKCMCAKIPPNPFPHPTWEEIVRGGLSRYVDMTGIVVEIGHKYSEEGYMDVTVYPQSQPNKDCVMSNFECIDGDYKEMARTISMAYNKKLK